MNQFQDANETYNRVLEHWALGTYNMISRLRYKGMELSSDQEIELWGCSMHSFGMWMLDFNQAPTTRIPAIREAPSVALRAQVIERDEYTCLACGSIESPMHVDHILPVVLGGETVLNNLQTLCAKCNLAKGVDAVRYVG